VGRAEGAVSVPGGFFKPTGAFIELVKIEKGIADNEGRLTADSSASLDLWLEMREEWHKLHRAEVEKRAQESIELVHAFSDTVQKIAEAWGPVTEALANMARAAQEQATPKGDRWSTVQTHEDCIDCEEAVEDAIERAKYRINPDNEWTTVSLVRPPVPGLTPVTHVGQARKKI
jgi:hypothetical protein